jgi:hypothetical protein
MFGQLNALGENLATAQCGLTQSVTALEENFSRLVIFLSVFPVSLILLLVLFILLTRGLKRGWVL